MSPPHFDATLATQPRQLVSWALLAGAAGLVNATAFLACARFVTHVTGTVTRIGLDGEDVRLVLEYTLVLICFILGAMTSVAAVQARALRGRRPAFRVALGGVTLLLCATALFGAAGAFGPFGGIAEQPADFALLSLLGYTMGLQNATIASATAIGVRTTHMTGPASDLGVHLGIAFITGGDARATAFKLAALRASKLAAFILGAALAVPLVRYAGFLSFVAPAVLVAAATAITFRVKGALTAPPSDVCRASAATA